MSVHICNPRIHLGRQPLHWLSIVLASRYPQLWVTFSSWVWAGFIASLPTNRTWQKLWNVTLKSSYKMAMASGFPLSFIPTSLPPSLHLSSSNLSICLSHSPHSWETSHYIVNSHIAISMWQGTALSVQQPVKTWRLSTAM